MTEGWPSPGVASAKGQQFVGKFNFRNDLILNFSHTEPNLFPVMIPPWICDPVMLNLNDVVN